MPRKRSEKTQEVPGKQAAEIHDQILFCMDALVGFNSAREIRQQLTKQWGLSDRTADRRIQAARLRIRQDCNAQDRQDVVATLMEQCLKIAKASAETNQHSNAIGAMRLYGELIGVAGNHRV